MPNVLARGLNVIVDRGFADRMQQGLAEIDDPLITQTQHVHQYIQDFETRGELIGGDPKGLNPKRAVAFQAAIALGDDLSMA